ncbi:MAG: type I-U CRISPR-associated protein Cas5/Cas6 [Acidobacteria bacterium]|nr:type I-U CRISPR-associated protein Cas5/Cas6 [Acidobacteriota bacterium]
MQLILNVTFPFERFHGGEFPPSPSRLFQALIAGSHRGIYIRQNAEVRDRALEWLENIAPPIIETCQAEMFGAGATNYVPNNDNSFAHIRTAKSMRAFVLREDSALRYVWLLPDSEHNRANAEVVCAMARLVTNLGHGQDAVFVNGEILEDGDTTAKASIGKRIVFQPKEQKGGDWTVPRAGALTAYKKRYEEFLKTGNSHTLNVPLRQVMYVPDNTIDLSCPYALFEMRDLLDEDKFFSFDGRDLRQPAAMVRHAVMEFFDSNKGERFKTYYGYDLISRKVYGHEPKVEGEQNKPVNYPHLAFIPIPNLYPDGRVRRILLAGFGFESETEGELFDDIARNLNGAEIKDNGKPVARLMQVEEYKENKFFDQFYGQSSRLWRSVTPIILSGFNRRGRKPEQLLYRALNQIEIETDAVESVAIYRSPIVPKTFRPMDYRLSGYLNENSRYHAEIIFKRSVSGCLMIGRGRHAGFGLMMPMTKHEHDETT